MGLWMRHVVYADDGIETIGEEPVERYVGFPAQPASEYGETMAFGEPVEQAILRQPLLTQNEAPVEEFLEVIDYFVVGSCVALFADHLRREFPVVIPAAAIFPVLDFDVSGLV